MKRLELLKLIDELFEALLKAKKSSGAGDEELSRIRKFLRKLGEEARNEGWHKVLEELNSSDVRENLRKIIDDVIEKLTRKAVFLIIDEVMERETFEDTRKKIDEALGVFNEATQVFIEDALYTSIIDNATAKVPALLYGVELSDVLYANSYETSSRVAAMVKDVLNARLAIDEFARKLYDGYDVAADELLKPLDMLPAYIRKAVKQKLKTKTAERLINQLKTRPLKAAYKQLVDYLTSDTIDDDELAKLIKVAVEEKARYYANRIAVTETFRAAAYAEGVEYMQDDSVQFVRFVLSYSHTIKDICDLYANINLGYGKGVVPKSEMRFLPLHPHCHCKYIPVYRPRRAHNPKTWHEAEADLMSRLSFGERAAILGSKEAAKLYDLQGGSVEAFINTKRKRYPIMKFTQL